MTDGGLDYEDTTADGLTYTPHAKYPELLIRRCGNIVQAKYKTGVGPQTAKALWLNPEFYSDPRFDFDDRWKMTHLTMQCASGLSVLLHLCFESIFDRTRCVVVDMDFKNPDPEARRRGLNELASEKFRREHFPQIKLSHWVNVKKEPDMDMEKPLNYSGLNTRDYQTQTLSLLEFAIGSQDRVALVLGHVGAREFRRAMHVRYPDWDPNAYRYEYAIFRDDESVVCNARPDETDAKPVTVAYVGNGVEQL